MRQNNRGGMGTGKAIRGVSGFLARVVLLYTREREEITQDREISRTKPSQECQVSEGASNWRTKNKNSVLKTKAFVLMIKRKTDGEVTRLEEGESENLIKGEKLRTLLNQHA